MIKQASTSTINSYGSRTPTPDNYCAATLNLNDPSKYLLCYLLNKIRSNAHHKVINDHPTGRDDFLGE